MISLIQLDKPFFENKKHGNGGGIPALKTIWEYFDLSLLFLQSGIRKHAGVSTWIMAFTYISALIAGVGSVNQSAAFIMQSPILQQLLSGIKISQSAFSRFLTKQFDWLKFSAGRLARLQEHQETRFSEGDIIALDDTKVVHPYGKKIPFLCWLYDHADKRQVWCMNLLSTLAVLQNGMEYPMLWRFWVKSDSTNEQQTKLDLAKQMLLEIRRLTQVKLWVAMDRWFLCKDFLVWLMGQQFDWVTKAKRNTVLYRKVYDSARHKDIFVKLNPKILLREVYPQLSMRGKGTGLSIPEIYLKLPYETTTRRGKPVIRQRFVPIAAIAGTYAEKIENPEGLIVEKETAATFRDAYLLISNRMDAPDAAFTAYVKRWRIEVFFRNAKQELGLTSCFARSEAAHFAHLELLFTAETLLCYGKWELNQKGVDSAPSHSDMVRCFFNASHRIDCCEQLIQVYFDMTGERFARLFEKFWPCSLNFNLWNWNHFPENA